MGMEDPMAVINGVMHMMNHLPADQREAVVGTLRRAIIFVGAPSPTMSP